MATILNSSLIEDHEKSEKTKDTSDIENLVLKNAKFFNEYIYEPREKDNIKNDYGEELLQSAQKKPSLFKRLFSNEM